MPDMVFPSEEKTIMGFAVPHSNFKQTA